jgi:carotenoid cleavage dioxygenase-like enzyme
MKRNAEVSSIRWFECDPCHVFHPMNAYEDGGKIIGDSCNTGAAPLFPDPDGRPGDPAKAVARLMRWTLDLAAKYRHVPGMDRRSCRRVPVLRRALHGFFAASSDRSDCFDTLAHINLKTNTRST